MACKKDLLELISEEFEDDLESLEGCRKLKEHMKAKLKDLKQEVRTCNSYYYF